MDDMKGRFYSMAGILSKMGNNYNIPIREYTLTDLADIADLPTTTSDAKGKFKGDISFSQRPPLGSICQVITATELRIFMLGENGWVEI